MSNFFASCTPLEIFCGAGDVFFIRQQILETIRDYNQGSKNASSNALVYVRHLLSCEVTFLHTVDRVCRSHPSIGRNSMKLAFIDPGNMKG